MVTRLSNEHLWLLAEINTLLGQVSYAVLDTFTQRANARLGLPELLLYPTALYECITRIGHPHLYGAVPTLACFGVERARAALSQLRQVPSDPSLP